MTKSIVLVVTSRCMECDWFDDSAKADLNARKHVEGMRHAVITSGTPYPATGEKGAEGKGG